MACSPHSQPICKGNFLKCLFGHDFLRSAFLYLSISTKRRDEIWPAFYCPSLMLASGKTDFRLRKSVRSAYAVIRSCSTRVEESFYVVSTFSPTTDKIPD